MPVSGSNSSGPSGANDTPVTLPDSSVWISLTMIPRRSWRPISLASWSSLPKAGSRSSGSIAHMYTSAAPSLIDDWQASVAIAPPPTTITRLPVSKCSGTRS